MSVETNSGFNERRSEARSKAQGDVKLWAEGFASGTAQGQLVDVSPHGFRAQHSLQGLTNGQFVQFEYPGSAGRARVIWTHIAGEHVESGFMIESLDRSVPISLKPTA